MASCANLERCGFFINFEFNSEVIQNGWIRHYCECEEKSESCLRKQYKKKEGKIPPDNMTPTGKIIGG